MKTRLSILSCRGSFVYPFSFFFSVLWLQMAACFGQPPSKADHLPLSTVYSAIKAQESHFPLPETEQTITIGKLDLSIDYKPGDFKVPKDINLVYETPTYKDGSFYKVFIPIPKKEQGDYPKGQTALVKQVMNLGAQVTVANIRHLNIRIAIENWKFLADQASVTFRLGDTVITVPRGASEVIFKDVSLTNPVLSIQVDGALTTNGKPAPYFVKGLLPLKIEWKLIGAGVITIPVLPVSIVYAPVADLQKKNQASTATSSSTGNISTVSFSSQNSNTGPVPSSFESAMELSKKMSALGAGLSKIPNGYTQAIGTALTTISGLMGSASATETNSLTVTKQHALAVTSTNSLTQTALSSQGGPGEGDIILYYYNARVMWYSLNGQMTLAILGFDGSVQATAGQLKEARKTLITQNSGLKHPVYKADTASISAMLKLDPFATDGPDAVLLPPRFVDISKGAVIVTGGGSNISYNYQLTASDLETNTIMRTQTENDNAGFLSFLGIGVTETKTVQSQISHSSSSQNSVTKTFSSTYNFNGNGSNENYAVEVYFDVVFGAYAFRDVTTINGIKSLNPGFSGVVTTKDGKPKANQLVKIKTGNRIYNTSTDYEGKFRLNLPLLKSGLMELMVDDTKLNFQFAGKPIKNVKVQL